MRARRRAVGDSEGGLLHGFDGSGRVVSGRGKRRERKRGREAKREKEREGW